MTPSARRRSIGAVQMGRGRPWRSRQVPRSPGGRRSEGSAQARRWHGPLRSSPASGRQPSPPAPNVSTVRRAPAPRFVAVPLQASPASVHNATREAACVRHSTSRSIANRRVRRMLTARVACASTSGPTVSARRISREPCAPVFVRFDWSRSDEPAVLTNGA